MTKYEIWSVCIAGLALIVSVASFYLHLQDKPKLRIISKYVPASEYSAAYIALSLVNTGKRPLVLRMWGGNGDNGKWVGEFFGNEKKGLRLGEKERHDLPLYRDDMIGITPENDIIFTDLWVENSQGKRYPVPNSRKFISQLLNR